MEEIDVEVRVERVVICRQEDLFRLHEGVPADRVQIRHQERISREWTHRYMSTRNTA